MVSVMIRNRLFIKGVVRTMALLLAILVLAFKTGTRSLYVDIVNGDEKRVSKALGLTFGVKTNATAYSLLVDRFGLREEPDWRLAAHDEMRDFLGANHLCFNAGKSIVAMEALAWLVEMDEIDDPPGAIRQLRSLLQEKDATAAHEFIRNLSKRPSERTTQGTAPAEKESGPDALSRSPFCPFVLFPSGGNVFPRSPAFA